MLKHSVELRGILCVGASWYEWPLSNDIQSLDPLSIYSLVQLLWNTNSPPFFNNYQLNEHWWFSRNEETAWSFPTDHHRRWWNCWRCPQRCYLWSGSALTSASLLTSFSNLPFWDQKPPAQTSTGMWQVMRLPLPHPSLLCFSFTHRLQSKAVNRRIWDTIVADLGHLKYSRCVWFTTQGTMALL